MRPANDDSLLRAQRLLQEYMCMAFARIETQRLVYFARNQAQIRAEVYSNLHDAMAGDAENMAAEVDEGQPAVGRRLILPATFTGGPRYMQKRSVSAEVVVSAIVMFTITHFL